MLLKKCTFAKTNYIAEKLTLEIKNSKVLRLLQGLEEIKNDKDNKRSVVQPFW